MIRLASIQTGIELQDNFTQVIYGIINSVNQAVSAMDDMQHSMNADIDTSSIEAAREEINQATIAMDELNTAMQDQANLPLVNTDVPVPQPNVDPVEAPIIPDQSRAPPTDPVEIPVTWNTDGLDVFTGTGIERFEQEVQSTNTMLNTLNDTQAHIQQTANTMDILPDAAIQDISGMGQRLATIQTRIQAIENNPVNMGTDQANNELEQLRSQLNQAIQEQNNLNQAMDNMDVSVANESYLRLSQTVSNTERYIRDNTNEQGEFNQAIQQGTNQADGLMNTIKGAVAAYVSIQGVGKALNISDELTQTKSRLNLMNDGAQTTAELFDMIYASAQTTHAPLMATADAIAKMGNNAGAAFNSSAELVTFMEQVNKQFAIGGASASEQSNALLQLSQAMAAGALRGDELNSILEAAPEIARSIESNMGWAEGSIKSYAEEGAVTAQVVKQSLLSMADETNAVYESMPYTFSKAMTDIQSGAIKAFQPVLEYLNSVADSQGFQTFVNGAIEAMAVLANIVLNIFDMIGQVGAFISENWSVISPIVWGVIAALAVYAAYLAIVKGIELASAAATAINAVAMSAKIGITAALTGTTMAATAAQMGYNGALYACPIVWIIILIIALIAGLVALCNWIAQTTGAANSGIGIIVGALAVAVAFIGNLFVALINMVIDIFVVLWNFIAAFVNFFGNVFTDPIGAIARLFFDLVDCILGLLQTLAGAIDAIFGSDLSGAVQGWRDDLGGWVDDTFGQGGEIMAKVSGEDWHVDRFEYGEAWDAGVAVGDGISDAIGNFDPSPLFGGVDIPDQKDYASQFSGLGDGVGSIADDTGSIKDSLDITSEDLKYLRDIAEQEAVNRFTTAEIKIEQTNNNNISSDMDLDGVVSGLTDAVNEAVDVVTGRGD